MKKKASLILFSIALAGMAIAQAPQGVNYQAVARDAQGLPIKNTHIALQFSVYVGSPSGTAVYVERDTTTTNEFGLFTVVIGSGTATSGTFATINWNGGGTWLGVGIDPTGGTTYANMGTTQLQSVPYALNSAQWYSSGGAVLNTDSTAYVEAYSTTGDPFGVVSTGSYNYIFFSNLSNHYRAYIGQWNDTAGLDVGTGGGNTTGTLNLVIGASPVVTISPTRLVGIGTTAPAYLLDMEGGQFYESNVNTGGSWQNEEHIVYATSGAYAGVVLYNATSSEGGMIFGISTGGLNVTDPSLAYAPVNASAFNVTSDITVKKDVQYLGSSDYSNCLQQIRNLQSIRFRYNTESATEEKGKQYRPDLHLGVVAQSLPAEVVAHVDYSGDGSKPDMKLGMSLADMEGLLVAGIKALDEKQAQYEADMKQQKEIIQNLQNEITRLKAGGK